MKKLFSLLSILGLLFFLSSCAGECIVSGTECSGTGGAGPYDYNADAVDADETACQVIIDGIATGKQFNPSLDCTASWSE